MAIDIVLRGGSRDGESTAVADGVRRLLAASDAPGMLEVYEANGETEDIGHDRAQVFVHAGMQEAGDMAPELLHAPLRP